MTARLSFKDNRIVKELAVFTPNPFQKQNKGEALAALFEMERIERHLKLGDRYKPSGKAYRREVRKVDRRYRTMIRQAKATKE